MIWTRCCLPAFIVRKVSCHLHNMDKEDCGKVTQEKHQEMGSGEDIISSQCLSDMLYLVHQRIQNKAEV